MRVPPPVGDQVSIGVAIAVPLPYAESLTRARVEAGDPEALAIPPHITLLPPTRVEPDGVAGVSEHLRSVAARHRPFVVGLGGTDTFRPISPVVFVAVTEGADDVATLHRAVNAGPLEQPLRFPFHPHVTIAHDLDEDRLDAAADARAGFMARFPVADFALYAYGDDGVWREHEVFALVAGDRAGERR